MPEEKRQFVTSLRIDSDLWKEARVQAIRHDITLTYGYKRKWKKTQKQAKKQKLNQRKNRFSENLT